MSRALQAPLFMKASCCRKFLTDTLRAHDLHACRATAQGMHTDRLFTVCYLPLAFFTLLLSTVIHNERTARRRVLVSFSLFFLTVLAVPLVRQFSDTNFIGSSASTSVSGSRTRGVCVGWSGALERASLPSRSVCQAHKVKAARAACG